MLKETISAAEGISFPKRVRRNSPLSDTAWSDFDEGDSSMVADVCSSSDLRSPIAIGLKHYFFTTLIVVLGTCFGLQFVVRSSHFADTVMNSATFDANRTDFASGVAVWDAEWYAKIVRNGYSYSPERQSSVAFFPAYPLLAYCLVQLTGLTAEAALLTVSHAALICSFVVAAAYVMTRLRNVSAATQEYVLLAMGLLPSTFYLRMIYTESLMLFFVILTLFSIQKNWPTWLIAIIVGAATGTRSVGVVLFAPLAVHLLLTSPTWRTAFVRGVVVSPLACWGLLAFVLFQWCEFSEPLAFVKAQAHWNHSGEGVRSLPEKVLRMLTFASVRSVYDSSCGCYWAHFPPKADILFNLRFLEPLAFIGTTIILVWGAAKKLLTTAEWVLSAGLLLVPYMMQSDRMCMAGQLRFSSVIFPIYLVVGQLLGRLPPPVVALLGAFCGFFLAIDSAMFVSWYDYY